MAKPVLQNKNQLETPCVCLWLNSLMSQTKTMITQLISTVVSVCKTILLAMKLIGTLMTNIDKELKIYALNVEVETEKTIVRPLEAPFLLLAKIAKPYADCSYIGTFLKGIKYVKTTLIGPVEKYIKDVEDMIDALEDQKKNYEGLDRMISALDDFNNVISNLCGTP